MSDILSFVPPKPKLPDWNVFRMALCPQNNPVFHPEPAWDTEPPGPLAKIENQVEALYRYDLVERTSNLLKNLSFIQDVNGC